MLRRTPRRRALILLLALATFAFPAQWTLAPAGAQVRIPAEALTSDFELQAILTRGAELEGQSRWGEALTHYEDALRSHPGRLDLKTRVAKARVHFDLRRRYADQSFVQALRMGDAAALDLYSEVLLKMSTYYVRAPDWQDLLSRGTFALSEALSDAAFVRANLSGVDAERIEAFRRELHRNMDRRSPRSRTEARDAVGGAAQLGQKWLGVAPSVVVFEYACGATGSLDPYSAYLTASQLEDVYAQIEGNFVGLGIELKADSGALLIVRVIRGSPADRVGIQAGDRFVEVDGKSTRDISTDRAADLLKGSEGSEVEIALETSEGQLRRVRVRRQRVEVPSVEDVKIIDAQFGVAYFHLSSFQKTTSRDVDAALWQLHREGMRSLVVDLRGNPGGLLTSSVEVADKFVTEGTIVSTRGRSAREDFDYRAHRVGTWLVPMVVLIDGDTASAGEILAGAIHDHRRGKIVGQRSYGKGSVQGIFPLSMSKSGVRLTTAKFYSPNGQAISHRGVQPDVRVRVTAKPLAEGESAVATQDNDPVLSAALQTLREQVSQRQG